MAAAVKVGPWGARGGVPRDIGRASRPQALVSIAICSSELPRVCICGFSFVYVDQHDELIAVRPWGNIDLESESEHYTITNIVMGPDEYLYSVSGTADDSTGITSLTLVTNQQRYTAGRPAGSAFSVPLEQGNGKVVAFFGRSDGDTIKALGIYVPIMQGSPVKVGPWGSSSYGVPVQYSGTLEEITVYSTSFICGITVHMSPFTHWGTINGQPQTLTLTQGEYLNNISGSTAEGNGVTSLEFTTNKRPEGYGPFGCAVQPFSVPLPDDRDDKGAVVGFFGRKGESLVALGVYVGLAPNQP